MLGIVTGRKIGKNKEGDVDRLILQVELIAGEDVRSIELFTQAGEDTNPGNNCRVNIIPVSNSYQIAVGISDDLLPEVAAGEKEIYSTDNPVTTKKARLKLDSSGNIILNQGTDSAVKYSELETAFNQLKSDFDNFVTTIFNLHTHATAALGAPSIPSATGAVSTADITPAESDTVLIP